MSLEHLFVLEKKYSKNDGDMLKRIHKIVGRDFI